MLRGDGIRQMVKHEYFGMLYNEGQSLKLRHIHRELAFKVKRCEKWLTKVDNAKADVIV